MKHFLTAAIALTAAPAFAHEGVHMHPHANDPSWVALMVTVLAGVAAVSYFLGRNK